MNQHTTTVSAALADAMSGNPMPAFQSAEASQMLQAVRDFASTANVHDTATLGSYALRLLVDRLMNDASAERDTALFVDKLRGC